LAGKRKRVSASKTESGFGAVNFVAVDSEEHITGYNPRALSNAAGKNIPEDQSAIFEALKDGVDGEIRRQARSRSTPKSGMTEVQFPKPYVYVSFETSAFNPSRPKISELLAESDDFIVLFRRVEQLVTDKFGGLGAHPS
jgi:hypothetical protein